MAEGSPFVQAKLRVSPPDDKYEREADQIADQVMRMPAPDVLLQRDDSEQAQVLQKQPSGPRGGSASLGKPEAVDMVSNVLSSPGQPLERATRTFMESRFGHDFSMVRVHANAGAAASARAVNALAYTVGSNVVFADGKYAPGSSSGRRLLAHELAHVVQQQAARPARTEGDKHSMTSASRANAMGSTSTLQKTVLQRQSPPDDPIPVGPPSEGIKLPPRCSVGWKNGEWFWKCEGLPKIGSTPEVPLDPRDIPKKIRDLFGKKEDDKKVPVWIDPEKTLPPDWLEQLCRQKPLSPLCVLPGKKDPSQPKDVLKPVGVFWTTDLLFEHDKPTPDEPSVGLTSEGAAALSSVISLLKLDPTLQVRIIGHASAEGSEAHNQALSARRAQLVFEKLKAEQLEFQVMDPMKSDGQESGCSQLQFGVWACGEARATQGEQRPEERKVSVTYLRNPPLPAGPLKLTPPKFTFPTTLPPRFDLRMR